MTTTEESLTLSDCETVESLKESTEETSDATYDAGAIGLWIVAIILIIIFTLGIWWGFSSWSGDDNCDSSHGKRKGGNNSGGCGAIGAGLIWLIVVIIFVCAVYKCGWAAIVIFLILFILVGAFAWWWGSSNGNETSSRNKRD